MIRMEIINSSNSFQLGSGTAATIGFFDGVHRGHCFLLEQLKSLAGARKLPTTVITFPQHPQSTIQAGFKPDLLSTLDEKIARLSTLGMDYCLLPDFTKALSQLSAREFIQEKLHKEWHVKLLLIGYDHRFGKNRTESFQDYVKYGNACGMGVSQALELPDISVNSTLIRTHLLNNKLTEANRMLSYFYGLHGIVIKGNQLGRKIGFPTANLESIDKNKVIPGNGIYAAWVYSGKRKYGGMAYIGKRPTVVAQGTKRMEVHLLDFSGNLYGKTLRLEFVEFIRNDKQFASMEELKKQLFKDREKIMRILAI
jgi:riboflavin kinase/FMN adenylyltransferase